MEPHGLKPVVPGLPRLVRYGEILSDNFVTLVGVIRRHVTSAESAVAPRLFAAFIHGLKSRGILRRRIKYYIKYTCQCLRKQVILKKLHRASSPDGCLRLFYLHQILYGFL